VARTGYGIPAHDGVGAGGGGKVILMSHLGRPKNGPENIFSLKHLVNHLSKVLETKMVSVKL